MTIANEHLSPVIAGALDLSEQGQQLARAGSSPRQVLDDLRAAGCLVDALHWLPQLLDKQHAVWWGCLCCWDAYRDRLTPEQAEALQVTLDWLREPSEASRQALLVAGEAPLLNSADHCLRMAAHWASGSMADEDQPEVLAPPQVTAKLSTAVALIAASSRGMFEINALQERYLALGYEVLEGRLDWSVALLPSGVAEVA